MKEIATHVLQHRDIRISINGEPLVEFDVPAGAAAMPFVDKGEILGNPQRRRVALSLYPMSPRVQTVYDDAFARIEDAEAKKVVVKGGNFKGYVGYYLTIKETT